MPELSPSVLFVYVTVIVAVLVVPSPVVTEDDETVKSVVLLDETAMPLAKLQCEIVNVCVATSSPL